MAQGPAPGAPSPLPGVLGAMMVSPNTPIHSPTQGASRHPAPSPWPGQLLEWCSSVLAAGAQARYRQQAGAPEEPALVPVGLGTGGGRSPRVAPHCPRTAEPVPGTLPALLKRGQCPPARRHMAGFVGPGGRPLACHPRDGRLQAGAALRQGRPRQAWSPQRPASRPSGRHPAWSPPRHPERREQPSERLSIHTPRGSASKRERP